MRQSNIKRITKQYDSEAKCPKCGHEVISTCFCQRGYSSDICWPWIEKEHLHRHCQRCHFEWLELTIRKEGSNE